MLVKVNKIRGRITEESLSVEKVAEQMSIDKSTLYRRLRHPETITIRDVVELQKILRLNNAECINIFFPSMSHSMQQSDESV